MIAILLIVLNINYQVTLWEMFQLCIANAGVWICTPILVILLFGKLRGFELTHWKSWQIVALAAFVFISFGMMYTKQGQPHWPIMKIPFVN
jgi:hypothetical protein